MKSRSALSRSLRIPCSGSLGALGLSIAMFRAAIETMDNAGVKEALTAAVRAAAERSRELGK